MQIALRNFHVNISNKFNILQINLPSRVWFPVADGSVWGNHHYVNSCDRKADGWGARTWYLTRQGWYYINDSNGSASGCGMTYSPDTILQFMVCYKSFRPEEECIGPFNA
jgi:hypothetical protein